MRKVTVGFRCDPILKDDLIENSIRLGLTLSEYLENLCESHFSDTNLNEPLEENCQSLKSECERLKNELTDYEELLLAPYFQKYKGKILSLRLEDGSKSELLIKTPKDLLRVILSTLKV